MSKITPEHLARQAVVYIRQSTPDQVVHNLESKRRQYNLPERARQLGWSDVAVIDDDLGRSGGGVARPGFEKLLASICEVRVGVVVSIEASRLARNGRDWHTLLEFCGLVGTLIADEDGVYDPRQPNDRLLKRNVARYAKHVQPFAALQSRVTGENFSDLFALQESLLGRAPRRRESPVEEDSTQRVVD
jgi:hypothetical protein